MPALTTTQSYNKIQQTQLKRVLTFQFLLRSRCSRAYLTLGTKDLETIEAEEAARVLEWGLMAEENPL